MNQLKSLWRKYKKKLTPWRVATGVLIIVVILWALFRPAELVARYTVEKGTVERVVLASGRVEVSDQVGLGFQQSGTVSRVLVAPSQKVRKGQMIAQLDLGTLAADLREAQANLAEARFKKSKNALDVSLSTGVLSTDIKNAQTNLDTLRTKLLSSDLELYPKNSTQTQVIPPRISGTYRGTGDNASYVVTIYPSASASGVSARVQGGGADISVVLSAYSPNPIGSTGLYIELPSTDSTANSTLKNTEWTLNLPNTESAQYSSTLYQYQEAKKSYDTLIQNQQKDIQLLQNGYNGYTEYDIAIERAQAAVDRVQSQIRLRGIYSPGAGSIGRIDLKPGQSATQGVDVVTVLGEGQLQTKLRVPESSIGGIQIEDPVTIIADIDPDTVYTGTIASINQSETYLEGTPVYETTVIISKPEVLKSGMTVRGRIITDSAESVIKIPELALFKVDENNYVVKKFVSADSNDSIDIPVTIKLRGSDGVVGVTASALQPGDSIMMQSPE